MIINDDFNLFMENKINKYASNIINNSVDYDLLSLGEISFYISLQSILQSKCNNQYQASLYEIGMMDAINDVLKILGVISEGCFYDKALSE
ncbi:hypothetical protein [Zooshikella sp. RANM57]|uniref:hypothetical protein n=1 Tax=Zooshikella sp. RANM57 TaxID=3425863 RepID=UPI003D6F72CD